MKTLPVERVDYVQGKLRPYYFWECPFCAREFSTLKTLWETGTIDCPCGAKVSQGKATKE